MDCPLDTDVLVRAVRFEADVALRMREMWLRPGGTVRVVQRAAFGGRVVATGACVDVEVALLGRLATAAGAGVSRSRPVTRVWPGPTAGRLAPEPLRSP